MVRINVNFWGFHLGSPVISSILPARAGTVFDTCLSEMFIFTTCVSHIVSRLEECVWDMRSWWLRLAYLAILYLLPLYVEHLIKIKQVERRVAYLILFHSNGR